MKNNKRYIVYIAIAMVILLVPLVGMIFPYASAATLSEVAEWPETRLEDGSINKEYLSGMGDYFQDHFALHDQMIVANSALKNATIKSSANDQVIMGREGWLFFDGTLDDYLGRELLSERELYAAAHNLAQMQEYAAQNGSTFLFTVAPNKNSLYGEYMPYNYIRAEESNVRNLQPYLKQMKVSYADLFEAFASQPEELYFQRDSHWNNKGAALAYNTLMENLKKNHETYVDVTWTARTDHMGDIDEMLNLLYYKEETQYYPDMEMSYVYVNDVTDNMDTWIETSNRGKENTLLMYRDSFGESLIPFFAEEFNKAYFSRLMPYNLANITQYQPDYVILEKVERNLIDLVVRAPILPARIVPNMKTQAVETQSTIKTDVDGPYLVIDGEIDEQFVRADMDIYVALHSDGETYTYETSYLSNEERMGSGYCLYLENDSLPQEELQLELIISNHNGEKLTVQTAAIEKN